MHNLPLVRGGSLWQYRSVPPAAIMATPLPPKCKPQNRHWLILWQLDYYENGRVTRNQLHHMAEHSSMLFYSNLNSLASRREDFSHSFLSKYFDTDSCLHSLLPPPRPPAVTSRLRYLSQSSYSHTPLTVLSYNMALIITSIKLINPGYFTIVCAHPGSAAC